MIEQGRHVLHPGELRIQRRMNTPIELTDAVPHYIHSSMPQQHADFYTGLPYLALATMDNDGRPWATLLVTKSADDPLVGTKLVGRDQLHILSLNGMFDPFYRALEGSNNRLSDDDVLFAGVGVDYSNRRRNKLAGKISTFRAQSDERMQLCLHTDQHLGNCPKYITVRSLEPFARTPDIVMDRFESFSGSLPESCKELIARSNTVYLATRHVPDAATTSTAERDMGLNHRGGAPGFVRVYEEPANNDAERVNTAGDSIETYLVLPDHSGNRFYQSLGNIETDRLVGLTFPDFATGDMLYLTGIAENLFGDEAEALMPRARLLTRVRVTGAVFVKGAIQLRMTSIEELSPYNPPVKYLRTELANRHLVQESLISMNQKIRANLVSTKRLTSSVQTFTFELSAQVDAILPGGFGIFDFSKHFDCEYRHMDEVNPQAVNDDYVRTWTISSAASFDINTKNFNPMQQVEITVKHKTGGAVSSFLHDLRAVKRENEDTPLSVGFVGSGNGFSCFSQKAMGELPIVPPRMLWIAGGVGITPFMSMWDGIINLDKALNEDNLELIVNIVLVFAGRDDDLDLLRHFMTQSKPISNQVSLKIVGFQSLSSDSDKGNATREALVQAFPDADMVIDQKRIDSASLADIEALSEREVYLCGPDGFMRYTQTALESIIGHELKLHTESYSF